MNKFFIPILLFVALTLFGAPFMTIISNTTTQDNIDIASIAKLTFNADQMTVAGPGRQFALSTIRKIVFSGTLYSELLQLPSPLTSQVHPNPFSLHTDLTLTGISNGPLRVFLFDCQGRKVATLHDRESKPEKTVIHWDGKDQNSRPLASGRYLLHINMNGKIRTSRLIISR